MFRDSFNKLSSIYNSLVYKRHNYNKMTNVKNKMMDKDLSNTFQHFNIKKAEVGKLF